MVKKYSVTDYPKNYQTGDWFVEYFDSLEEANNKAMTDYSYLPSRERKKRYIYVGILCYEDLNPDDIDGDDDMWYYHVDARTDDDTFDSIKYEQELAEEEKRSDDEDTADDDF